jgi:rubrerythrin
MDPEVDTRQLGDPDLKKVFQELESEKQRHEDDLEAIVQKLTGP